MPPAVAKSMEEIPRAPRVSNLPCPENISQSRLYKREVKARASSKLSLPGKEYHFDKVIFDRENIINFQI